MKRANHHIVFHTIDGERVFCEHDEIVYLPSEPSTPDRTKQASACTPDETVYVDLEDDGLVQAMRDERCFRAQLHRIDGSGIANTTIREHAPIDTITDAPAPTIDLDKRQTQNGWAIITSTHDPVRGDLITVTLPEWLDAKRRKLHLAQALGIVAAEFDWVRVVGGVLRVGDPSVIPRVIAELKRYFIQQQFVAHTNP